MFKTVKELMTATADKIRTHLQTTDKITSQSIPDKVDEVHTVGLTEGVEQGKTEAYAEVEPINAELERTLYGTDTGGKSYYDEFWDNYQDYGKREAYNYAFAYYNDSMFNPKYDIVVKGCTYMFYCATISAEQFNKILQSRKIDFSKTTSVGMVLSATNCEELPFDIDLSNATSAFEVFAWNGRLKKIKKIIVSENTPIEGWFTNNTNLENLTIEGTIGQNGFNVQWSTKLTHESLMSIINALKDNSGTDTWKSITLGAENIAKLSAEELKIMDNKQWEYA